MPIPLEYSRSKLPRVPLRRLGVVAAPVAVVAAVVTWARWDRYHWEMHPVYAVIAAGEQGWADDATNILHRIIARSPDQHALAERLLLESNGSLVAEGMVLAVRSGHPRARSLVQLHLTDHRWNWSLTNNYELAKQLLLELDGKPVESWVASWLHETPGS
jgi:hypothetical protein